MIFVAASLLLISLVVGIRLSSGRNSRLVVISAIVVAVLSFVGVIFWISPPVSESYRQDLSHFDFVRLGNPIERPEAYTLTLARGEITPVREKWSFVNLGRLVSYTNELGPVETEPNMIEVRETKRYFKGISSTFSLPGMPAKLNIGWDDRGAEFINVIPFKVSGLYIRPFTSYYGVFPSKRESFAATRLLISGSIEDINGSVFGLARGKMAFLIVQPEVPSPKVSLTCRTIFDELTFTKTPYANSNNLTSFEDARKLLLRGMVFPRHENGILSVLGSLSPEVAALLLLLAISVFVLWIRWLFPAMFLSVLVAMMTMTGASSLELNSTVRICERGGEGSVYAMATLFSSPLWDGTTQKTLEKLSADNGSEQGKWASFLLSVRFPSQADLSGKDAVEEPEEDLIHEITEEEGLGAETEDEENGTENLSSP